MITKEQVASLAKKKKTNETTVFIMTPARLTVTNNVKSTCKNNTR